MLRGIRRLRLNLPHNIHPFGDMPEGRKPLTVRISRATEIE